MKTGNDETPQSDEALTWLEAPVQAPPEPKKRWWWAFLFLSLLLHGLLVVMLYPLTKRTLDLSNRTPPKEEVVEINLVSKKMPKHLADIPPPEKEEVPEDAKAAALYNQKVKQEQVAKTPPGAPGQSGGGQAAAKKSERNPSQSTTAMKEKTTSKGAGQTTLHDMSKSASDKSIASRFGPPGASEEFFPDYKVGPHTYINALRYPNISYFVELKRKFSTAFNPLSSLRANRQQLSGGKIDVVLGVTVDPKGNLSDLFIIRPSSISDYDETALRAVRNSAPFRAPPAQLLENDQLLRMSWTFTVYF